MFHLPPEPVPSDGWCEADLLVEFPQHCLDRGQVSLDLDNKEDASGSPPGQHIDGASLSELRVSDFDAHLPGGSGKELAYDTHQSRVSFVKQTVKGTCAPSDVHE